MTAKRIENKLLQNDKLKEILFLQTLYFPDEFQIKYRNLDEIEILHF